jgi:hypothetical protein
MTMRVSHSLRSDWMPSSACPARRRPSKVNGRGDDADGQRAELAGDRGDDGRATGAGAAALARGHEDHVGPLEDLLDLLAVVLGGLAADLGVGPGAEAAGELAADVELDVGVGHQRACASVFTAMNSTPLRPTSIMRLTALTPPPPMPTTLITAR